MMCNNKFRLVFIFCFLVSGNAFSQSIKAEGFKKLLINKNISPEELTDDKFKTGYSGQRKESRFITNMYNKKDDEYLFIYQDDKELLQSIEYYIPSYHRYQQLYSELKSAAIKVSKLGKTYENGKIYYELQLTASFSK